MSPRADIRIHTHEGYAAVLHAVIWNLLHTVRICSNVLLRAVVKGFNQYQTG
jgi:hypothetical protein